MHQEIRRSFKRSGTQFKWGGQGNLTVLYKTKGMRFFRRFDVEKDAARIALNLDNDYDFDDIWNAGAIEAWTWDNKAKVNTYEAAGNHSGGIGVRSSQV